MPKRMTRTMSLALLITMVIAPSILRADEKVADEKTRQVVRQIADYYKSLDSFTVNAVVKMSITMGGQDQSNTSKFAIAMQRPNRFALRFTEGQRGGSFITDGQRVWAHVASANRYSSEPAPQNFQTVLENELIGMFSAGAGDFVGLLVRDDPYAAVFEDVTSAKYVGVEKLGEIECHHLRFEQEQIGLDLWIQTGDKPLALKLKPDFTAAQAAQPGPQPAVDMTIALDDWQPNAKIDPAAFTLQVPAGAQRVVSLMGNPLLGQPAPAFSLPALDGTKHALADHKGKDIVILDFWATWCGWCGKAMPTLDKIAQQYKDKNVVLYAVNQRESADAAKAYMAERQLNPDRVLLDATGSVGDSFSVEGLPTTIIIDKDGTIQAVYSGVPGGSEKLLAEQLTRDLDMLTAGRKIVELK